VQVTSSGETATAEARPSPPTDPTDALATDARDRLAADPTDPLATDARDRLATAPTDPLATDLYALVVHLHKNCNSDLFEAVGALDLTLTQIKLLHHLEDSERELTLKEGAELVHVSLPAASRMVDDLFRRGFVARHEDPSDRRMKRVNITDDGRAVIRRLNAARLAGFQQFVQTLTEAEHEALAPALNRLLERPEIAACRPEDPTP
jgi:DNA-binding MarR family transcriptional regulator